MAKIKMLRFDLVTLLSESKKLIDYLQKTGITEIENLDEEERKDLVKYQTSSIVNQYEKFFGVATKAYQTLEKYCNIKKSLIQSFNDSKEIDYNDYKSLTNKADEIMRKCNAINSLTSQILEKKADIVRKQTMIDFYTPWKSLDIPMCVTRTATTSIFIGSFNSMLSKEDIVFSLAEALPEIDDFEVQIISSEKLQTCVVVMCHHSDSEKLNEALKSIGFIKPDNPAKKLPSKLIEECLEDIDIIRNEIDKIETDIATYAEYYDSIRFLSDYFSIQSEKYQTLEKTGSSEKTIYIKGYVPEHSSDDLKFEIENRFTAQMDLSEPDYENEDVPVLIENHGFAAGVENITDMYSHPSNKDVDPNPVMSFFYYAFFGLMLSDAGYGLLMVIFAVIAKYKVKVKGNMAKSVNMVLYSGISTMIWGALFGGWFGDLIPTICTTYLGWEKAPSLAIWFEPIDHSMDLLLYSFLFGIIHLFVGLGVRFYMLAKKHDFIGAVCDVIPVYVFVVGFAIVGAGLIKDIPSNIKSVGVWTLLAGSILIVLTAGRSSKNILGKLGGGLYGLYNTASGYLGDILSYSRLLALSLVTGVIANVVNLLGTMLGNIFAFIIIFILGHTVNLAINLIGTYVHTNRLQYVEFFSKFYEGSGRNFTPFKFNSKYFTIKEEKINE